MRNLYVFEITEVVPAQIEEARREACTCGREEPVLRIELREVDVPTVSILLGLPVEDSKLIIVL